jgi:hypothetical protein
MSTSTYIFFLNEASRSLHQTDAHGHLLKRQGAKVSGDNYYNSKVTQSGESQRKKEYRITLSILYPIMLLPTLAGHSPNDHHQTSALTYGIKRVL